MLIDLRIQFLISILSAFRDLIKENLQKTWGMKQKGIRVIINRDHQFIKRKGNAKSIQLSNKIHKRYQLLERKIIIIIIVISIQIIFQRNKKSKNINNTRIIIIQVIAQIPQQQDIAQNVCERVVMAIYLHGMLGK